MGPPQRSVGAGWRARQAALALAIVLLAIAGLGTWMLTPDPIRTPAPALPAATSATGGLVPHAEPQPIPEIAFQDAAGTPHTLADFRGRVVLLNLWATWCAPCRAEMPTLDHLQTKLGGKDFEVVALSIDTEGPRVVKRFFDQDNVSKLAVYVDPSMDAQGKLEAVGIPTTLLIDREGREVARKTGPAQWDRPEMIELIKRYLPSTKR